jgi:hypothetical protein
MRRRLLLRLGLTAIVGALAGASCLSPTLPLPPPELETVTQSPDPTHWIVTGTCAPGALVTVLNDDTGTGVVYEDRTESGHWFVELEAEKCDRAWASQQYGGDRSKRTNFTIDEITQDNSSGSGTCP